MSKSLLFLYIKISQNPLYTWSGCITALVAALIAFYNLVFRCVRVLYPPSASFIRTRFESITARFLRVRTEADSK